MYGAGRRRTVYVKNVYSSLNSVILCSIIARTYRFVYCTVGSSAASGNPEDKSILYRTLATEPPAIIRRHILKSAEIEYIINCDNAACFFLSCTSRGYTAVPAVV